MTTEDDRCDQCKEFDKDGCPNCGPTAIGATYGLTPSEIAGHPQRAHVPIRVQVTEAAPSWADKYCDAEPEQPVEGEERGMRDAYSMVLPASLLQKGIKNV